VARQAEALDSVIREFFGTNINKILDAACGIGTQAIGLATLGYSLTASDISARELAMAEQEARARGLEVTFKRSDMRGVAEEFEEIFHLVIACDNAIPHLLSDEDILRAFRSFHAATVENGGAIISVRDYGGMDKEETIINPRRVHNITGGRVVLFDIWEFNGDYYDVTIYSLADRGDGDLHAKAIRGGRYYCVSIQKLEALFEEAGFEHVTTLRDRFFQPLIVARKKIP
jgi:SAM-dependent methyltransferase